MTAILALLFQPVISFAIVAYPVSPDPKLTTGSLCTRPVEYRYPEHVKYCGRQVSPAEKDMIIRTYEKAGGFQIYQIGRRKFKIDHYIPLCMGGSNEMNA